MLNSKSVSNTVIHRYSQATPEFKISSPLNTYLKRIPMVLIPMNLSGVYMYGAPLYNRAPLKAGSSLENRPLDSLQVKSVFITPVLLSSRLLHTHCGAASFCLLFLARHNFETRAGWSSATVIQGWWKHSNPSDPHYFGPFA